VADLLLTAGWRLAQALGLPPSAESTGLGVLGVIILSIAALRFVLWALDGS
jgi:hypothetical protein